ncbi:MAG: ferritin-like domain-containing protein [Alphaproteobacteria bacterium]
MIQQEAPTGDSLTTRAVAVLEAAEPARKVSLSHQAAAAWRTGETEVGTATPPDHPARPARPELLAPRHMPKRNAGGEQAARAALMHAVAHIEFNAMDLAWDLVSRFTAEDLPCAFYDDWVGVAAEEAEHFNLVARRLAELGIAYGDLPAHDGLWQAAAATAHDLAARLAVVPLVLEARGLDVTPAMINRLRSNGDDASAAVLEIIYREEIGHVAVGRRWFEWICARRDRDPEPTYQSLVREHFKGQIKPPFNATARDQAGFPAGYYEPLAS